MGDDALNAWCMRDVYLLGLKLRGDDDACPHDAPGDEDAIAWRTYIFSNDEMTQV